MAENDNPIGSLMDTAIDLGPNEEILEDIEIEALANGLDFERPPVEGIEIIEDEQMISLGERRAAGELD